MVDSSLTPKEEKLGNVYDVQYQIQPILQENRGKSRIEGVLLDKDTKKSKFVLGDYEFTASHIFNSGWEPNAQSEIWKPAGAILIQTGDKEFFYAGFVVSLTFKSLKNIQARVGILKTDKGSFIDGKWMFFSI